MTHPRDPVVRPSGRPWRPKGCSQSIPRPCETFIHSVIFSTRSGKKSMNSQSRGHIGKITSRPRRNPGRAGTPPPPLGADRMPWRDIRGQISWFSATTASIHLLFDVYKCLTRPGDRSGASLGPPRPAGRPHCRIPGVEQKNPLNFWASVL